MANSLRAKINKLEHNGHISSDECKKLLKKLDGHDKILKNKIIDEFFEKICKHWGVFNHEELGSCLDLNNINDIAERMKNDFPEEKIETLWKDIQNSVDNCITVCKKNGLTIFKIMKSENNFYADYFNNTLFHTPTLTYYEASKLAKNKFNKDSLENRLIVAKEFFLNDYKMQVNEQLFLLNNMSV